MEKFFKNTNGAVTVFVTFLLIPAILISGTAVDLTRIYTARSIVQNANQLAANSVLTQYNALLHDLYGVFGIAKDDPILVQLLDEYISVAVFGKSERDVSLGTLQLFYGSDLQSDDVTFTGNMNLRNPEVLRRQIEEYMKFRGPVIIVKEIMELLGSSTFNEDTGVINDKLQIDDGIAAMYDKYKELYNAILDADKCTVPPSITASAVGTVSRTVMAIYDDVAELHSCYVRWHACSLPDDDEEDYEEEDEEEIRRREEEKERERERIEKEKAAIESRYNELLGSIAARASGGKTANGGNVQGLRKTLENAINNVDKFKPFFDDVVRIAIEIDEMNAELTRMLDDFEKRLETKACNPELYAALTEKDSDTNKPVIEIYRDILKWKDIESMARVYKESGYEYIDEPLKDMLNNVCYRDRENPDTLSLSLNNMDKIASDSRLSLSSPGNISGELTYEDRENAGYGMPPGFIKFGEHPGDNTAFYVQLAEMMETKDIPLTTLFDGQKEGSGKSSGDKQKSMIEELFRLVDDAYTGMANNPLGAKYINNASNDDFARGSSNISKAVGEAQDDPVVSVISNPAAAIAGAGDYLLLLTYCTSVFSNYATARPDVNGKTIDETGSVTFPKSITGAVLSPEVNYFFQSEWEYLYNGSNNAGNNLNAVSRLIYIIRVICNYITVFSVSDVTAVVTSIRGAFSYCAPIGFMLGELARSAFVAAESAYDVAALRSGHKVALIKSAKDWTCSPRGLTNALGNVLTDTAGYDNGSEEKGLTYSNYLTFFMLAKGLGGVSAATELTQRTADLIEWNLVNYEAKCRSNEEQMLNAVQSDDSFKMEDMKTDFTITTTVNMSMLFLSMPLAQNTAQSRGIWLSRTMPLTVTGHRGY